MPLDDRSRDEINEAIFAGRKIEAIKIYREATGQGLMESKDFIERLTASLRKRYPDKVPAQTSGCVSAVVLLAMPAGALLCYFLV